MIVFGCLGTGSLHLLETLPSRESRLISSTEVESTQCSLSGPWQWAHDLDCAIQTTLIQKREMMKEGPYLHFTECIVAAAGAKFISGEDGDRAYSGTGVHSSSGQRSGQSKPGCVCSAVQSAVLLLKWWCYLRPCSSSCSLQTCIPQPSLFLWVTQTKAVLANTFSVSVNSS